MFKRRYLPLHAPLSPSSGQSQFNSFSLIWRRTMAKIIDVFYCLFNQLFNILWWCDTRFLLGWIHNSSYAIMPQYKRILQIGCFCQYNLRKEVDIFTQCWDYLPVTITTSISVLFATNLSKYANHSGLFWTTVSGQQNADTWEPIYLKDLWASYRLDENEFTRVTCVICVHARLPTISYS